MRRILIAACLMANVCFAAQPVIFDTDMGNDIDDALALAMLHALSDRGECALIGVTLTNAHPAAVPYIRMIDRFYGRRICPWARPSNHSLTAPGMAICRRFARGGRGAGWKLASRGTCTRAARGAFCRRARKGRDRTDRLQHQSGRAAGFAGGRRTREGEGCAGGRHGGQFRRWGTGVQRPHRHSLRQGRFRALADPHGIQRLRNRARTLYPLASIEHDFTYASPHPIAESYRAYHQMPYDRPTWDLTAVLEAVRSGHGYFSRSAPGTVLVESNGATRFTAGAGRPAVSAFGPVQARGNSGRPDAPREPATRTAVVAPSSLRGAATLTAGRLAKGTDVSQGTPSFVLIGTNSKSFSQVAQPLRRCRWPPGFSRPGAPVPGFAVFDCKEIPSRSRYL